MTEIVLSGGDFGGETYEISEGQTTIEIAKYDGSVWTYDINRSADHTIAVLVSVRQS